MEFANKEYLFLLLLLIPYLIWYMMYRKKTEPTMRMSDTFAFRYAPKSWKVRLMPLSMLLRMLAFVMIVLVLARPQTQNSWKNKSVEGIDIMLAMDVSTSMLAEDLKPNRIEAAKQVASEFIAGRPNDNIGLSIFAGEAFTQCPMTTEDGSNNRGDISPMTAAEIARSLGIRVYTIGVGTNKVAPYPMPVAGGVQYVNIPVEIDNKMLSEIAAATEGDFYRATNTKELRKIYQEIDRLEKSKLNVKQFSKKYEAYQPFALIAVLALLLEILLRITIFRRIP